MHLECGPSAPCRRDDRTPAGDLQRYPTQAAACIATTGRVGAASTTGGVAQALARLRQTWGFELDDRSAEGGSGNRVDVVEVDDTVRRDVVVSGGEFKFGDDSSDSSCDGRHDNRADAISNRIPCEHEHWTIAARCRCEPHLTALHRPNPPSPRQVPTRRSDRSLTRRR